MGYQGTVAPGPVSPVLVLRCSALALLLGGCEVPKEINPVWIYDQVSGRADRGRPVPPGLGQPFPNLASVPARPEKPPLATREQLSAALAADRGQSRDPLEPRAGVTAPAFAPAPGTPPLPGAPPAPAQLAGARPIPWDSPPEPQPTTPQPATPQPAIPPGAVPAAGGGPTARPPVAPPELLGPPPLPSRDLLAPPPLPSPDLLAPAPARR